MPEVFPHFQAAYLAQLRRTYYEAEFVNNPRGNPSRERLGVSFRITDPVQRHIALPSRKSNIIFNFAEAMWYLSGSDRLDFIGYYAPSIANYSRDGEVLLGTAYGPRIFHHSVSGGGQVDQWESVLDTLREDYDSKRAVMQIFEGDELTIPGNIDVACTLALQFMIRDDALHGVGFMRANDAFRGAVSDVFSFTFLLEFMATQLGLPVGSYIHHVGSFHVYESDAAWGHRVLREAETTSSAPPPFPRMPSEDNWPHLREVLRIESLLRTNTMALSAAAIATLDLPRYWRDVVALLEIQRQLKHRTSSDLDVVAALPDVVYDLVVTKWPRLRSTPDTEAA